ncbi:CASP C terminal-domain-containing protein [Suillus clintonianus]|uniref:CASP C terminal-domain-containing protein n=1 Tax=Suillus clintonianus TaxID=1904413 RepID=UPI001B8722F4|nr:CASP C terminal-domain-containing protein [Suillus clintonianus]KAG2150921.1 CASP C terminal-domain-containing protein [Suillus clintonianus]
MSGAEHNFSGALATWKDIKLQELQKTLDAQGIEIVDNQKESVLGRKQLADRTKEFKKIPDDEKLNSFKGLLKAYQTEIDSLTKRSKVSENAFLSVYKVLAEAPDPYPLLEAAVDQAVKATEAHALEAEVARLRAENTELRQSSSALDASKRRVEQLEARMDELVAQKESEINAAYDERMRNYEEREQDLQRQVALYRDQVRDLRQSNESNQAKLFDHSQRQDQEVISRLAEADMIMVDLERANSRVATVEQRNEALRGEIEALRTGSESSERVRSLTDRLFELESECTRLEGAVGVARSAAARSEERISDKAREADSARAEVDALKTKLKTYADYDEVKRELEILKYVEFAGLDPDDDWSSPDEDEDGVHLPNPNADKANAQHGKSLEVLLATKNKRILEELTRFRILHTSLEASLKSTQNELADTHAELAKQQALCEKLETDLLALNTNSGRGLREEGGESGESGISGLGLEFGLRTTDTAGPSTTRSTPIPFTSSADTSILPIVTSQRDRFRQRNAELEEELRKHYHTISELRTEVKSLQSDNLKLYEKVRYMQSYREQGSVSQLDPLPPSSASAFNGSGNGSGSGRDELGKWRTRYEDSMNPFEAFRGREATRAYEALNPVERGVLVLTRGIIGNRRARTAFIFYAAALHLLVVVTVYECAWSSGQLQVQPGPY